MRIGTRSSAYASLTIPLALFAGCSSSPKGVRPPAYDRQHFAAVILERCDADKNDILTTGEAAAAPGIAAQWSRYDSDKDNAVSREELESHVQKWIDNGDGLVSMMCAVRLGGKEIGDVTVKLIPDDAMGDAVQPAETISQPGRSSPLSIPPELKPERLRRIAGMQYGLYHVEVSHPTLKIAPAPGSTGIDISPSDQAGIIKINVERK